MAEDLSKQIYLEATKLAKYDLSQDPDVLTKRTRIGKIKTLTKEVYQQRLQQLFSHVNELDPTGAFRLSVKLRAHPDLPRSVQKLKQVSATLETGGAAPPSGNLTARGKKKEEPAQPTAGDIRRLSFLKLPIKLKKDEDAKSEDPRQDPNSGSVTSAATVEAAPIAAVGPQAEESDEPARVILYNSTTKFERLEAVCLGERIMETFVTDKYRWEVSQIEKAMEGRGESTHRRDVGQEEQIAQLTEILHLLGSNGRPQPPGPPGASVAAGPSTDPPLTGRSLPTAPTVRSQVAC